MYEANRIERISHGEEGGGKRKLRGREGGHGGGMEGGGKLVAHRSKRLIMGCACAAASHITCFSYNAHCVPLQGHGQGSKTTTVLGRRSEGQCIGCIDLPAKSTQWRAPLNPNTSPFLYVV